MSSSSSPSPSFPHGSLSLTHILLPLSQTPKNATQINTLPSFAEPMLWITQQSKFKDGRPCGKERWKKRKMEEQTQKGKGHQLKLKSWFWFLTQSPAWRRKPKRMSCRSPSWSLKLGLGKKFLLRLWFSTNWVLFFSNLWASTTALFSLWSYKSPRRTTTGPQHLQKRSIHLQKTEMKREKRK